MRQTVGGRCDITIDGAIYHATAELEIDESSFETDVVDNSDNTIGRTVKPSHYELDIKFRHMEGFSIEDLMGKFFDLSMVERDVGQSIMLTDAFLKGKPKRNTGNGEISGLTVVTDKLRRIAI